MQNGDLHFILSVYTNSSLFFQIILYPGISTIEFGIELLSHVCVKEATSASELVTNERISSGVNDMTLIKRDQGQTLIC